MTISAEINETEVEERKKEMERKAEICRHCSACSTSLLCADKNYQKGPNGYCPRGKWK